MFHIVIKFYLINDHFVIVILTPSHGNTWERLINMTNMSLFDPCCQKASWCWFKIKCAYNITSLHVCSLCCKITAKTYLMASFGALNVLNWIVTCETGTV